MRDHQSRIVQLRLAVQDQVEVERAGRAGEWPLPAPGALDRQQAVEHLTGWKIGVTDGGAVQKPGLIADTNRRGVDPGRVREVGEEFAETRDGEGEGGIAVAQVAAKRDGDGSGRATPPSGCPAPRRGGR